MIFDVLNEAKRYYGVNENFEEAFDFIKKAVEENLPVGKYKINGDTLFASVQEYTTKSCDEGKFEGHRNHIDIQYIVSGIETMDVVDISKATTKTEYNAEKDVEFYNDSEKASKNVVEAGEYGIFFPNDIHKPGMSFKNEPSTVKKIVVKIKI